MAVGDEGVFDKMKNNFDQLKTTLSSKTWQFTIIALIVIFSISGVYVYRTYVKEKLNKKYVENKEFIDGSVYVDGIQMYYFYTQWCPHCKKTTPIWTEFKELPMFKDGTYKGTAIEFISVDCDKDPSLADKFNVKGYPTIKLIKGDQIIEYDAKPNIDTLKQFIATST
jgi:thiol-disulfide isomerase/thioredoxin